MEKGFKILTTESSRKTDPSNEYIGLVQEGEIVVVRRIRPR